ncbi:MAG: VanZ family protein [Oscillospiraceae bacterium]|nr:VanZ family protein [Oscillospiraceae bacterium]
MDRINEILNSYGIIKAIPFSAAAMALYIIFRIVYIKAKKKKRETIPTETARALLIWYFVTLIIIVWLTDLPDFLFGKISWQQFKESTFFRGEFTVNGRFWRFFHGDFAALRDFELLANIALFIPYGVLLPTAYRKLKWWAVDLIGLGTTAVVEVFQPYLGRSCDIDDVIGNTFGTIIGCAIAKIFISVYQAQKKVE